MQGDKIKRAIADLAFELLMDETLSAKGDLSNFPTRVIRVDYMTLQVTVKDPGKGNRLFTVKVTENI